MNVKEKCFLAAILVLSFLCLSYAVSVQHHHYHHNHSKNVPKKTHHLPPKHHHPHQHRQSNAIQTHKPAKVEVFSKQGVATVTVPTYEFGYKIHDPRNKNYQEKSEVRLGDAVKGFYSVLQPNGQIRVVRYHSDDSGFHSKVSLHKSSSQQRS